MINNRRKIRIWIEVDNFSGSDLECKTWAENLAKDMCSELGGGEIISDFGWIDQSNLEGIFTKTPKEQLG